MLFAKRTVLLASGIMAAALAAGHFVARAEDKPPSKEEELRERQMASQENLKEISLGLVSYACAYDTRLPPAAQCDPQGKPLLSWRVLILPFLMQKELYKQFHIDEPWDSEHNKKLLDKMPAIYAQPGVRMKSPGLTAYQVFVGKDALFDGSRRLRWPADIPDGTANTILVVEGVSAVPWTKPADLALGEQDPRRQVGGWYKPNYASFSRCDGSSVTYDLGKVSEKTFRNAIMPADGSPPGEDW
jgi:hypothetical protein